MLLGKPWIERNKTRRKEEESLEQKKQELKYFMNRRITHLIEEKELIEVRIRDFDIDYVLDKETHVNVMTKSTWEILGRPTMIPSLGGIELFRGKIITLCGRIT